MAKLVWDALGTRDYEYGVSMGVLFPYASGAYQKGVAWNGLTSVNESPSGADAQDVYADDMLYASLRAAEKYGATIEALTYPPEYGECDGSASIAKGVRIGQQTRKPFGFCYRTAIGDDSNPEAGYKLHIVYGATANPSEKSHQTVNESPENVAFSWEVTTVPVPVTGHKPTSSLEIDSTTADATKLAALEKILYGDAETEPRLPLPDEIATLMAVA